MTAWETAAQRLLAVLEAENGALARMDLTGAAACLGDKQAAVAALPADPPRTPALRDTARRLCQAADENRLLLERAIGVQSRVLEIVRDAVALRGADSRYARGGAPACAPCAPVSMVIKA